MITADELVPNANPVGIRRAMTMLAGRMPAAFR